MAKFFWLAAATLMPGYYIYTLGDDGHVQSRVNAICDDDEQAKRHAEQLVDGHVVELWQEARKIAEFHPDNRPTSRPDIATQIK
jgi:hypothetical protein